MNSPEPLRILLIDKDPERASQVCQALRHEAMKSFASARMLPA